MPRAIAATRHLLGAIALLIVPSLASAHTGLRRTEPTRGSRLTASPTRIVLWFTARPELAFSRIRLRGARGEIQLEKLMSDTGYALRAEIPETLLPGEYAVRWQTASADGHAIHGEFRFSVTAQTDTGRRAASVAGTQEAVNSGSTADGRPTPPSTHAKDTEYHTVRWFEFAVLLSVLGVLGFRHGVLPPLAARGVATAAAAERARRLGQRLLVVYAVAAALRLYSESIAVGSAEESFKLSDLIGILTTTMWGIGWLVGLAGALVLLIGWRVSKRSVAIGTPLSMTGVLAMVLSPSLSGHAVSSHYPVLSVLLDVLHVTAAGVWLGGLFIVLIVGIPAMNRLPSEGRNAAVGSLVNSFHPIALFCVPVVVLAGAGTSWLRLRSLTDLTTTDYGRALMLKVGVVLLVVVMGTYNSSRVRRQLGSVEGTRRLRMTASAELLIASIVLAVTTVLVTTPVPTDLHP